MTIAALAVRTGISPLELERCEPEMLDAVLRVVQAQADEAKRAADDAKARRR